MAQKCKSVVSVGFGHQCSRDFVPKSDNPCFVFIVDYSYRKVLYILLNYSGEKLVRVPFALVTIN